MLIGVISDTHGLLRPEAVAALAGCGHIIHAGDIGASEVLDALAAIAPVTAVRGNNDKGAWAERIPSTAVFQADGLPIFVLHDVNELDLDPAAAGFGVVIAGHSHVPAQDQRNGVLFFNPGSAGPRRFRLPIAVGRLHVENGAARGELVTLG
jgi:putative phosphoesterase